MCLCAVEGRRRFPVRLAEMAVCGPRDQPMRLPGLLHALQEAGEGVWREGEILTKGREVTPL